MKPLLIALAAMAFFLLALRGALSFVVPMGMECDASWEHERVCVFTPGVVGTQRCRIGKWDKCEVPVEQVKKESR